MLIDWFNNLNANIFQRENITSRAKSGGRANSQYFCRNDIILRYYQTAVRVDTYGCK